MLKRLMQSSLVKNRKAATLLATFAASLLVIGNLATAEASGLYADPPVVEEITANVEREISEEKEGNFAVQAADTNDQISEAQLVPVPVNFTGTISPGDDVDMVSFDVSAGQKLAFDIDQRSGSSLDSILRLFDGSGTQLALNDDGAAPGEPSGLESYLEHTFSSSGRYYAGVSGFNNRFYNPVTGDGDVSGSTGE